MERLGSFLLRYGTAVVATSLAALARSALSLTWGGSFPLITFFIAAMLTAWFAGLGPALLVLGLGWLAATYLFPPAPVVLSFLDMGNSFLLGAYLVFGVGGAFLLKTLRQARLVGKANLRDALARQRQLEREVAERRRLGEALRDSEERHRAICEWNSDFTYTATVQPDGTLELDTATGGIAIVTGYTVKDLNARGGLAALLVPDDHLLLGRDVQRVLGGETVSSQVRCRTRTGDVRWLRYLGLPEWDPERGKVARIFGAVQDITAAKQAQEKLEMSEQRFRSLVEKGWDAFALCNARGVVDYVSPSTTRILGYLPEELLGRSAFELIHPEDVGRIWNVFTDILQDPGGSRTAECRFPHEDGSWRTFETTGTNLLAEPAVQAVVVNFRDVTEQRRLEEELRCHAANLQEADRRKNEFLALLAHELRNPLAPLRNALFVLKQSGANGRSGETLYDLMERQVRQLTRLVEDLLDVSRIAEGKIQLRKEVVDLVSLVRRTSEAVGPTIEDRRHELALTLPDQPMCMKADPARLEQVLTNLLTNAAKYTDSGGRIDVTVRRDQNHAVICVRDTGAGIAPALLPHVFDLYVQAHTDRERAQGGLGIGLTLVRRLVEMHGGKVEAASEGPGKGSAFTIRLPVLADEQRETWRALEHSGSAGAMLCRRVLAVDDNVDAVDSLAMLLRLQGHEVRVAYEGIAALAVAEEFQPQVVLLDLSIPGLNGYEVARRLRGQPSRERALLVAVTGWGQDEDRRRSQEAGFDMHLVKPVEPEGLCELLAHPKLDANRSTNAT
jgi:PAS domain S-box-containing protein